MSDKLSELRSFLKKDINLYKKTLTAVLSSNVFLIDNITKYIVKHKGKSLRPLLVLMSARLLGRPNQNTYAMATVVELLHTASLIHDDVVDDAEVRRNFPSINAVWKNKISVLMGDYLLAKSLITACETGELPIMSTLAETAKRLSKGELFQIEKSRKLDITEIDYLRIISDKTAALISACCKLGAMTVTGVNENSERLAQYGENLGMAFQIKDDLLDYQSEQIVLGKAVGADLKEKKITLPLILAFKEAPNREKKSIINLIKKGVSKNDLKMINEFTDKYGGLQKAHGYVLHYAEQAGKHIESLPESEAKRNAYRFIYYIINRKK
jgi:octaprenyl-diphosphate synthase